MEKPLYPSYYMRITQGYNTGTHLNSFAIDEAGKDQNISKLRAPFTGIIKKIYTQDANEVWLESESPVEYPDGTIDYMTIMFAHSNDVSDLFVGKKISQGENFYSEGTKGNTTGNHCHIECGQGKFYNTGWYKNKNGTYSINNGKRPEECLWVDNKVTIIDNNNYTFKKLNTIEEKSNQSVELSNENPTQTSSEKSTKIVEKTSTENPKLIFTCEKSDLYGIYLKKGQKLYLK